MQTWSTRHVPRAAAVAALLVAALLPGVLTAPPAQATNACPAPIQQVLDQTPATHSRNVALTFDDGPSPRWTPQVLDILAARGIHATFFLLGQNAAAHPELVRRIVAEGHTIGNHTDTHANLDQLSPPAQAVQMDRATSAIYAAAGVRPCFFRGPGGSHHGASVKDLAWARGMTIAGWSNDPRDWAAPGSPSREYQDTIVQRATEPVYAHPIVLMHDGSPGNYRQNTVDALNRVIDSYAFRGYAFTDPAGRDFNSSRIQMRYNAMGGPASILGNPVTEERRTPDGSGAYTHYGNGSIYWSPWTGAYVVRGAIRGTWSALGWERSVVGYPTTDELPTPYKQGAYNHFQGGSIYWSPATGAHEVRGAIRQVWSQLGWENSLLGFPTTNEQPTPYTQGAYNHFQGGSIYWSPATGAHEVHGDIRARWGELGWENSALGFPTSDEYGVDGGRQSDFQKGSITWTPAEGAVAHQAG